MEVGSETLRRLGELNRQLSALRAANRAAHSALLAAHQEAQTERDTLRHRLALAEERLARAVDARDAAGAAREGALLADLVARDLDLRILRRQLRAVRGLLHAAQTRGYLSGEECAAALDELDAIDAEERAHQP